MITVIAPHARPEFSANLLANFARQRGVEAQLLVVENGPAEGECPRVDGVRFTRSDPHQADAMNAGLAWLRARGGGNWARFDDDDYYGPHYLADTMALLERSGADVVGKPWGFVMLDDGLWRFAGAPDFTGGTLAARSTDVAAFSRRSDDDLEWCRQMRAAGAHLVCGDVWGYCYDRRTREAPRVIHGGSVVTRWGFGDAHFYGPVPLESVDDPALQPLRLVSRPSDEDVFAVLTTL